MKIIPSIALILTLCSCATVRVEDSLNTWIGQPESELIKAYGAPEAVYKASPSEKVLTYVETGLTPDESTLPVSYTCRINFTIKAHKVAEYSHQGADRCSFVKGFNRGIK